MKGRQMLNPPTTVEIANIGVHIEQVNGVTDFKRRAIRFPFGGYDFPASRALIPIGRSMRQDKTAFCPGDIPKFRFVNDPSTRIQIAAVRIFVLKVNN
ncbi:MAG: hypothetical protein H6660_15730 [Ardenticatenaceae bacterium]|nr:hypothetical protein [Ardenticatenaceae bacterium]